MAMTQRVIVAIAAIIWLLAVAHCSRRTITILEFVLPDGYRGLFWVIVDPKTGQAVSHINGKVTIHVPSSGVARVRDDQPFTDWLKLSARYKSGQRLRTATDDGTTQSEIILIPLTGTAGGPDMYLVGTLGERDRFYADPSGQSYREAREKLERLLAQEDP